MFRNLTYKQKLKLTGIGALLALIICYRLSISRTIEEYQKYSAQQVTLAANAGTSPLPALEAKKARIDQIFNGYALDTLLPEKNLLAVSSNYCKAGNLQLKEYKPLNFSRVDSVPVLTRIITVEGSFIACLKLIYSLESSAKVGRVSSVEYRSYVDPQNKDTRLSCSLYIQNLIVNNHDNH